MHYKNTDAHRFLPFNSCHPRHTKNNIPYSQALRICTIVDDPIVRDLRLNEMQTYMLKCGYPKQLILHGIEKAKRIPQETLRTAKTKPKENVLTFVSTNNPNNPNLWPLVHSIVNTLKTSQKMNKVLGKTKIINSKRQPLNLKRILTRAKFSSQNIQTSGSQPCEDKRCATCPLTRKVSSIKITSTNETFFIKESMNCKSQNVLYIITCNKCKEQYVGKTNSTLSKRCTVHRSQIKHKEYRQLGLSKHLEELNKNCPIDDMFTIIPFYKLKDNRSDTITKENFFIRRFKPKLNNLSLN